MQKMMEIVAYVAIIIMFLWLWIKWIYSQSTLDSASYRNGSYGQCPYCGHQCYVEPDLTRAETYHSACTYEDYRVFVCPTCENEFLEIIDE